MTKEKNILSELGDENATAYKYESDITPVNAEAEYHIPLEEFLYQANLQREREKQDDYGDGDKEAAIPIIGFLSFLKKQKKISNSASSSDSDTPENDQQHQQQEDGSGEKAVNGSEDAGRMVRNATWMSVFYLITTDILGPTSAPYAVSQLGFVPGSLLYFLLGMAAVYTGFALLRMFLKLDSLVYPMRNFGDVVGRIYGKRVRYGVDFLQALQLICNVAVIILGNGQGLYQVAKKKVCFAVMVVVWALAGMVVGQIRTLRRFGFLSNLAIWMNLFICFATMGIAAQYGVNYDAAMSQNQVEKGPVITKAVISGGGDKFTRQLEATMNIVYAYGGAMMFIEFMSEMRRPMDFWKGMIMAQSIIFSVYLLFGLFVYAYQGQFTINPANQGINPYGWQTALNVINLVSALIAAGLYGNVGIKVVYNTLFRRLLKAPSLESKYGKIIWVPMTILYWGVCYVIASAIPQFSTLTSLVGAVCILQFTYTFPPLMALGLDVQVNAMEGDQPYDPVNKVTHRVDTWKQKSRWIRGFKRKWYINVFHIVFFLAALATAVLGIYSSALQLKKAYGPGSSLAGAFSCRGNI